MNLPDALGQAPTSREELNSLSTRSLLCGEHGEESQSRSHDKIGRFLGTSNAASRPFSASAVGKICS
jgi:hypothetical protein